MESARAFKRKMLLWTNNWFQEEQDPTKQFTPDAMGITRLLQATGFRARLTSTSAGCCPTSETSAPAVLTDCHVCRVILTCPQSGLKIELHSPTSSSKCSSSESGATSGTTDQEIGEAADFTVTTESDEVSKSVSQVIGGLLHVMSKFSDLNHNNLEKLTPESTRCSKPVVQHKEPATSASNRSPMLKTPPISTLDSPRIAKTSPKREKTATPGRYGSLDTLIASGSNFSDDIPEPGQLTPKETQYYRPGTDVEVDLNATIVEGPESGNKKFISSSSPAVYCTEQFQDSSTFSFENKEVDPAKEQRSKRTLLRSNTYVSDGLVINAEDEPRKGPPPRRTPSPVVPAVSRSAILTKLQDLQGTVSDLIFMVTGNDKNQASIDDVSKATDAVVADAAKMMTDDARSVRSLSDFGGAQNSTRLSTMVRSIPRPNIVRKRGTTTPGAVTPTTSKQGVIATAGRRKSLSTTTLSSTETMSRTQSTTPKLGCQSRLTTQSNMRKILTPPYSKTGTSSSKCKEKTSNQPINQQLITPHRKYAHVQSTIPKSSVLQK